MSATDMQLLSKIATQPSGEELENLLSYQKEESLIRATETQALQSQLDRESTRNRLLEDQLLRQEHHRSRSPPSCCHTQQETQSKQFQVTLHRVAESLRTLAFDIASGRDTPCSSLHHQASQHSIGKPLLSQTGRNRVELRHRSISGDRETAPMHSSDYRSSLLSTYEPRHFSKLYDVHHLRPSASTQEPYLSYQSQEHIRGGGLSTEPIGLFAQQSTDSLLMPPSEHQISTGSLHKNLLYLPSQGGESSPTFRERAGGEAASMRHEPCPPLLPHVSSYHSIDVSRLPKHQTSRLEYGSLPQQHETADARVEQPEYKQHKNQPKIEEVPSQAQTPLKQTLALEPPQEEMNQNNPDKETEGGQTHEVKIEDQVPETQKGQEPVHSEIPQDDELAQAEPAAPQIETIKQAPVTPVRSSKISSTHEVAGGVPSFVYHTPDRHNPKHYLTHLQELPGSSRNYKTHFLYSGYSPMKSSAGGGALSARRPLPSARESFGGGAWAGAGAGGGAGAWGLERYLYTSFQKRNLRPYLSYHLHDYSEEISAMHKRNQNFLDLEEAYRRKAGYGHYGFMKKHTIEEAGRVERKGAIFKAFKAEKKSSSSSASGGGSSTKAKASGGGGHSASESSSGGDGGAVMSAFKSFVTTTTKTIKRTSTKKASQSALGSTGITKLSEEPQEQHLIEEEEPLGEEQVSEEPVVYEEPGLVEQDAWDEEE